MFINALVVGAIASTFLSADKSNRIDEDALDKYAKAFEKSEEAKLMIHKKMEYMNKRVFNVVKRKRAILEYSYPKFMEVYSKIQKVDIQKTNKSMNYLGINTESLYSRIDNMTIILKKDFSSEELICGLFTKGFNGMMIKDSERFLSAANTQLSIANVAYSQAVSICTVYDGIILRADKISHLLMNLNALFLKSICKTDEIITKNGVDIKNYSDFEEGILMTCVNIAVAITDIIKEPLVDEKGKIYETSADTIRAGELFMEKITNLLKEY